MSERDQNPDYWSQYTNFQRVKHALVREYLGGWFPILGTWNGRVLYIDTHAGRGTHSDGQLGSPLVALQTLKSHSHLPRLLSRCEFQFRFMEIDEANLALLNAEIAQLGQLPDRIKIRTSCGNCFELLDEVLANLRESQRQLAPAFVFVDPYGFKVPGSVLRELFNAGRVELFVNLIWRELDMAMTHARKGVEGMAATIDALFDGADWRGRVIASDFDERADQAVDLFAEMMGAKWATPIRMLGDNGATRYVLVHFTKHDAGRKLMKECMWKVCPSADDRFYAHKGGQLVLLAKQPDLAPLSSWVVQQVGKGGIRWQELHRRVLPEIWREKQVNDVVRSLRKEKRLQPRDHGVRFLPSHDPVLVVTDE